MKQETNKIRKFRCDFCHKIKEYPKYTRKNKVILVCYPCQESESVPYTKEGMKKLKAFVKTITVGDLKKLAKSTQFK